MGLARSAFQRRKSLQLPIYSIFATPFCDYKYSTLGIDSTLKKTFGDGFLFGQPTGSSSRLMDDSVKVGVVSTKEGSQRVSVIANYSRNPVGKGLISVTTPLPTPIFRDAENTDADDHRGCSRESRGPKKGFPDMASVS